MAGGTDSPNDVELSVLVCTRVNVRYYRGDIANVQMKESAANQNSSYLK